MLSVQQLNMSAGTCGASPKPALYPTSFNILIEGRRPMLVGDYWNSHVLGDHTHPMYCVQGSATVLCNGKSIVFTTASLSCGDMAIQGCATVNIN